MKALVTSGESFLGSHLVSHLIAEGHQTIAIDELARHRAASR
jgi:nucleoside-diphosphate-sugar epimerase